MNTKSREKQASTIVAQIDSNKSKAPELVLALVQLNNCLESLTFVPYSPSLPFEARLEERLKELIPNTSELSELKRNHRTYWDAILNNHWPKETFSKFIKEAFRHDEGQGIRVSVKDITQEKLDEMRCNLPSGTVLALYSKCQLHNRTWAHIPMMDFHCSTNDDQLKKMECCLMDIGLRGAILDSGNSFHFCGFDVVSQDKWLEFMAKCLLLAPLTDSRYIAHRLLSGTCALRINKSKQKPTTPFVRKVLWLENNGG